MCSAVFVDRFVQIIDIFLSLNLGLLFHKLILVGIGFQVCTVRIQNLSSYKSLCHCLTNDLVEYLLRNVGILVSAESVLPDHAYIWELFGQIVTDEPPVGYVYLDLLEQSYFTSDTIQISYEQHTEKNLRLDSRASVVLTVIRLTDLVDKTEIYGRIDLSQKVIPRHKFL